MNKSKKLAALFTGTAAVLMLSGTSAFAETRHRSETRDDSQSAQQQQTDRRDSAQFNRDSRTRNGSNQRWDRSQTQPSVSDSNQRWDHSQRNSTPEQTQRWDRSQTRSNGAYRFDNRSDSTRNYDRRGNESFHSYRGTYDRAPVRNESRFYSGRVSRIEHYRSGFRVWVGGAPYPFFIAGDRWARFPLRVGLGIRLGGYWDPLGYYNVYDVGPYAYSTAGDIHGVVESVDYRRGTAVIRDDVSGSFITVLLRGNDPRLGDLRTGDYVDLSGAWNRSGVFDAFNVANLRPYGYGQGPDPQYDGPRY
jgi:hypothetical protein